MSLLAIDTLCVRYDAIEAVKGISLTVGEGELVALIGANGAGKTTTLKAITGTQPWSAGEVSYQGRTIRGVGAHQLVSRGLAMVPEGRGVFARMSIVENLMMGAYTRRDAGGVRRDVERMFETFPRLKERAAQLAGTLSGGEQQMLAIARALLARPKLMLLDEPSLGLAPQVVATIFKIIREINAGGTTILLVEQNAHMALEVANFAYVLEVGKIVMSDDARTLAKSDEVRKAYLGVG